MTRGPLPEVAIRQAVALAAGRGTVTGRDLFQRIRLGLTIFCANLTVFVRVRRSRSHILRPEDAALEFREDILQLRRIPLTPVVARELWLLAPWGTWQYFRIPDDQIIEVRNDGIPLTGGTEPSPAGSSPPAGTGEKIAF